MKFDYNISVNAEIEEIRNRIEDKKRILDSHRPLPIYILNKLKEDFAIEWTHHSNAIEGNTLTIAETKFILQDGITIGGKTLREHFEVLNHKNAIDFLEELVKTDEDFRAIDILSIHKLVMNNILDDFAGRLRQGMVRIVGANFVPPNARIVPDLIDELVEFVNCNTEYDLITLASIFHHRFVWIHPFFDGNGRTVRLMMNLILMKAEYPPCFILRQDRKKYIDALNQANKGDLNKLILMIYQSMERSLNIYINSIGGDYEDYKSTAIIAEEPEIPYGQEYLSLLARRGKIDAYKEGRNWLTTKEAVLEYISKK